MEPEAKGRDIFRIACCTQDCFDYSGPFVLGNFIIVFHIHVKNGILIRISLNL